MGALLFAFGRAPGGARLYRELTRNVLGTQATHVDKLQRVWPGYLRVWTDPTCGIVLEGARTWIHEAGWTPYALLANYLTTGSGGVATNTEARIVDRYVARAVSGVLETPFTDGTAPASRRDTVEALRGEHGAIRLLAAIDGAARYVQDPGALSLASESCDLCHSGGALEHYRPDRLAAFLAECRRVLLPGGIASHVFDHRDHLYHADKGRAFLAHLALPDSLYELVYGHPLTYHNRLLPGEIERMFEKAGFERIAVRRMILPAQRYVADEELMQGTEGIARGRLAPRFQSATDADLRTAAAHYLYRKPA
ncbi:MAG TPA: methyltransferase domain-containing protein [Chthonomonadaceae bacterium]|nr:methyltransferase domain-containing protein [Chthonomonadaceae bacterium]